MLQMAGHWWAQGGTGGDRQRQPACSSEMSPTHKAELLILQRAVADNCPQHMSPYLTPTSHLGKSRKWGWFSVGSLNLLSLRPPAGCWAHPAEGHGTVWGFPGLERAPEQAVLIWGLPPADPPPTPPPGPARVTCWESWEPHWVPGPHLARAKLSVSS